VNLQKHMAFNGDEDKALTDEDVAKADVVIDWGETNKSILQARARFFAALPDGAVCPVCDRYGKVYTRKLNSGMAATLCWMVQHYLELGSPEWIDVPREAPRFVLKNRELGRLVHWNLAIPKRNDDDKTKKENGLWMPTTLGIGFATREVMVPKEVKIWKNEKVWESKEMVDVLGALNDKFDYSELMRRK